MRDVNVSKVSLFISIKGRISLYVVDTNVRIIVKTDITIIWGPNSLQPRIWEHNSLHIRVVLSSLLKILEDLRTWLLP